MNLHELELDEFTPLFKLRAHRNMLVADLQEDICLHSSRISSFESCTGRDAGDVAADLDQVCTRGSDWWSAYDRLLRDVRRTGSMVDDISRSLGDLRLVTGYIYLAERREVAELIVQAAHANFARQEVAS